MIFKKYIIKKRLLKRRENKLKSKRVKFTSLLIVLTLVVTIGLSGVTFGCKAEEVAAPAEEEVAEEEPWVGKTIGLTIPSSSWPWFTTLVDTYKEECDKYGLELIVLSADEDEQKQVSDIEDLIAKKVDMIVVCPLGLMAVTAPMKKAYEQGIPILSSVNPVCEEATKYAFAYSGNDVWEMARVGARALAEALNNEGKIVMIEGIPGQPDVIALTEGYLEELEKVAPNIECVDKQPCDWDPVKAQAIAEDFLTKYPDIDAIVNHDDNCAAAVGQIVLQHGYEKGEIIIIGTGGSINGIKAIREGIMYATVDQSPLLNAEQDIQIILKYFKGEEIPERNLLENFVYTAENIGDYEGCW